MKISFVIPAFNEEEYIFNCLTRITQCMTNKFDYEIIVIDNASKDRTPNIVESFTTIKLIKLKEKVTISQARNIGWAQSNYDIVVFLDADVLITNAWALEMATVTEQLSRTPLIITGCRYTLSETPSKIEKTWFSNLKKGKESYINSGNLITTKSVLQLTKGFDEQLITGEDVDFCQRAQQAGVKILINYELLAHHEGYPKTIKRFFLRERWHGTGDLKDIHTFLSSKVALFSFTLTFIVVLATLLLSLNSIYTAFSLFIIAAILNLLAVFYKFTYTNIKTTLYLFYLNMVYAIARTLSIFYRRKI